MEKYLNIIIIFALMILAIDIYCLSASNRIIKEAEKSGNASKEFGTL